mgnify:CR=1 FL=1
MKVATIVRGTFEGSKNNFYYVTEIMKDTFRGVFLGTNPGEFGKVIQNQISDVYKQSEFDNYADGKVSKTWLKYIEGSYTLREIDLYTNYKWKKVKPVKWVASPYNVNLQKILKPFIGKDELRPVMSYISVTKTGMFATDAHQLIHIAGNIPKTQIGMWSNGIQYGGAILDDGTEIEKISGQTADIGRFPNAAAVVPDDISNSVFVDMVKIYNYCKLMIESKFLNSFNNAIVVQVKPGENIGLNAKLLMGVAKSCLELGGLWEVVVTKNTRSTYNPILFVRNHDGSRTLSKRLDTYALLMPLMLGYSPDALTTKKIQNGNQEYEITTRKTYSYFSIAKNEIMQGDEFGNDDYIVTMLLSGLGPKTVKKAEKKLKEKTAIVALKMKHQAAIDLKKAAPGPKKTKRKSNWFVIGGEGDVYGKNLTQFEAETQLNMETNRGDDDAYMTQDKPVKKKVAPGPKKKAAPGPKKKAALAEVAVASPRRSRVFTSYKNSEIIEQDGIYSAMPFIETKKGLLKSDYGNKKDFKSLSAAKRYLDKLLKKPNKKAAPGPKAKRIDLIGDETTIVSNYKKQSKKKILQRALQFHEDRKPSAKKRDENKTSSKVLSPTPENLIRWKNNKGKFDMLGVDAKPGAKANADLKQSIDTWWKRFIG